MKKLFFILLLIASLAGACKKYDEGPWLSLRSAEGRFYGYSTLVKYTVNGIDSLDSYHDSLGFSFRFIHNEDNDANICIMNGKRKDGGGTDFYWGWELTNHNKIFKVLGADGSSYGIGIIKRKVTPEWEIIKLKYNDIRMKTNYNGKEYYIELKGN